MKSFVHLDVNGIGRLSWDGPEGLFPWAIGMLFKMLIVSFVIFDIEGYLSVIFRH